VVLAPAAGRILRVPDPSGRVVAAGTPLLEIGETDVLEVVVPVLSADAARIRAGACVWLEEWGGDLPLEGVVRSIEPSAFTRISALGIEEQRVNVRIDLPERPASLGDGFRVEAAIVLWEADGILQIPSSALAQRGDGWTVFVAHDGRAQLRDVRIGHRNGAAVEIVGGVDPGEEVILFPSDRVEDGVRVRARAADPR
jgi:HlyD family secretion protein